MFLFGVSFIGGSTVVYPCECSLFVCVCRTLSRVAVKKELRSEVTANQRTLQQYGMEPGDSVVLFNGIVLQTENTDSFRWAPIRTTVCGLCNNYGVMS